MKSSWSLPRNLGIAVVTLGCVIAGTPWASAQVALDEPLLATTARIGAVRYHVEPGQTRVWFETEGAVLYTHYSPDPLTLVIDLPGVDISDVAERTVVGSREVESVLATSLEGPNGKNLSRVEIKLATIVPYQLSGSAQALNLVFDGPTVPIDSSSPETIAEQPIVTAPIPVPTPEPAPPAPARMAKAPPAPSVPASSMEGPLASAIHGLSHRVDNGVLSFDVDANGRLSYSSFELDAPRRLVFDFDGVMNQVARAALPVERMGISQARIGQFRSADPSITRLVFDMDDDVYVQAHPRNDGLRLKFSYTQEGTVGAAVSPSAPSYVPNALAAMAPEQSDQADKPDQAEPLAPGPIETGAQAEIQTGAETLAPPVLSTSADEPAPIADSAFEVSDSAAIYEEEGIYIDNSGVVVASQDLGLANPAPPSLAPPGLPAPPPALTRPPPQTSSVLSSGSENLGQREYTGELITLDFKDGDIQDIFRLFADISGLNIVVQPGVSGRITLKLTEVPWDQALELILKTNKLGYVVEGNVIRIAPLSELATEEAERRRLAEEKALAGELFTQTHILSYAKASEIEPLLKRNLSARGDIVIDERTNTIIYTDLAEQITSINALVDTLDTPIPGVEIEARIVVTTRTFSRNLGVQWGFTGDMTQSQGNTTELVFPNRIQLGGQAIGNESDDEFIGGETGGGLLPPQSNGDRRGYAVNLPFAGNPTGAVGLSLGSITGAFSVDAALTAAERRGHVRIISAPKIITQNNKPAEIKQGVTFPVQVVANNTITVQFKDAVLQLQVTPQITSADTIILDIIVNNDSLDFGQQVQGIPSIVTQSATTQVLVADGSTTVIGGVFVNRQQQDERFVPLLHRIPILGNLFKSRDASSRNEELLIFLTPRIRKDTA